MCRKRQVGRKPRKRGLGEVVDYGPTRTATVIVGLDKGHAKGNQSGACGTKPVHFSPEAADRAFLSTRAAQVSRDNVGASRRCGKGWFQGRPEQSLSYEVVFIPNTREKTYGQFRKNMDALATKMGAKLCQDSVLVLDDNSKQRKTRAAIRK